MKGFLVFLAVIVFFALGIACVDGDAYLGPPDVVERSKAKREVGMAFKVMTWTLGVMALLVTCAGCTAFGYVRWMTAQTSMLAQQGWPMPPLTLFGAIKTTPGKGMMESASDGVLTYGKDAAYTIGVSRRVVLTSPEAVEESFKAEPRIPDRHPGFAAAAAAVRHGAVEDAFFFMQQTSDEVMKTRKFYLSQVGKAGLPGLFAFVAGASAKAVEHLGEMVANPSTARGYIPPHFTKAEDGTEIDMRPFTMDTLMDSVSMFSLGKPIGALESRAKNGVAHEWYAQGLDMNQIQMLKLTVPFVPTNRWWTRLVNPWEKKAVAADKARTQMYIKLIKARLEDRKAGKATTGALVDKLLDGLPDGDTPSASDLAEVRDHLGGFLFAGTITTASTSSAALWEITKDPSIAAKVQKEVDAAFTASEAKGAPEGHLDYTVVTTKLPYLEACWMEALRLWPAVPLLLRESPDPEGTEILGRWIPSGTDIAVNVAAVHRDVNRYGPTAAVFDPERWLADNTRPKGLNFLGFGNGPRACIGDKLAQLNGVTLIAYLMRSFTFSPRPDFTPEYIKAFIASLQIVPMTIRERRPINNRGTMEEEAVNVRKHTQSKQ